MKKIICWILLAACILAGLTGCGSLNQKAASLEESMEIPDNGMIAAAVFKKLKQENKIITFYGKSNGLRYEWTVFGKDIEKEADLNLGIEITKADSEGVAFQYLSEKNFGFSPTLSIYLEESWEAQSAAIYEVTKEGRTQQGQASITSQKNSILIFSPAKQKGSFEIVSDTTAALDVDIAKAAALGGALSEGVLDNTRKELPDEVEPSPGNETKEPSVTASVAEKQVTATQKPDSKSSESAAAKEKIVSDKPAATPDRYKTDPVPEGKPLPAEPDEQEVDTKKAYTCTFSIECSSIFNHLKDLDPEKLDVLPSNGVIFAAQTVTFYEGESVYDVLQRVCKENKIHLEASWTPMYNSAYVEGIHNLYEFDCGSGSGWMYRVDGWYPNYGCSRYELKQGEVVEWRYTCDLGKDIGGGNTVGR